MTTKRIGALDVGRQLWNIRYKTDEKTMVFHPSGVVVSVAADSMEEALSLFELSGTGTREDVIAIERVGRVIVK